MVSSFPLKKNTSTTIVFPILDADGDLVTSAVGLDSEVSIDGGTFADCTNESTEIATSSGMYKLTLTAAETNGDVIAIIVKTTTTGAKTTALVFYTAAQTLDETDAVCDAIKVKTDSLAFTTGNVHAHTKAKDSTLALSTQEKADVNAEVDGALDTAIPATNTVNSVNDVLLDQIKPRLPASGTISTHVAADIWTVTTRALTDKAGFSLAADQSAVTVGTVNTLTNWDKTGYALSSAGIDAIIDDVIEGTLTLRQAVRIYLAALAGKSAGGGTATITFRDNADSKNRISATVDVNGNRTAVTLDGS